MATELEPVDSMGTAMVPAEPVFSIQPTRESLVWQQNRLAEARYKLNPREQKLLLYVISMIEPEAQEFGKCKVGVQGYAEMTGLCSDDLYQELRDTALSIREKTLVVEGVLEPGMKRAVKRHGSWFEYVDEATGDGYVTIKLSSWLKPLLLQVRREFFKYKLKYALNLRSEYSIRLYQWLKRWQFAGRKTETVAGLRLQLGATEVDHEGKVVRENLAAYKHFKNKALSPALAEINAKTDLLVTVKEEKVKGSKAVGAVTFTIRVNQANQAHLETIRLPEKPQMEFPLDVPEGTDEVVAPSSAGSRATVRPQGGGVTPPTPAPSAAAADGVDAWAEEFGLSPNQRTLIRTYVQERGSGYVHEKAEIIRAEPRENAARAFLAALKQDWKAPRRVTLRRAPRAKSPVSGSDGPAGWRAFLQGKYPQAKLPKTYRELAELYPTLDAEVRAGLGSETGVKR